MNAHFSPMHQVTISLDSFLFKQTYLFFNTIVHLVGSVVSRTYLLLKLILW